MIWSRSRRQVRPMNRIVSGSTLCGPGRSRKQAGKVKPNQVGADQVGNRINSIATTSNAKATAAEKKAKHVKRTKAIVEAGDYRVAMFGRLQACDAYSVASQCFNDYSKWN